MAQNAAQISSGGPFGILGRWCLNRVKFRSACVLKALASGASALAIVSAFTVAASAQQAPAIVPDTAEEAAPSPIDQGAQAGTVAPSGDVANANADADADIVVTGVRASLRSAQARKRNASQIIDSIVAEDIGKLPDNNVSEALQRISGIQIERNQGEGSRIAIRGLTQVRTELNGRDYFTAGDGRTISLEDIPSELLAGIDVYKNPAADVIEGGLGGTVNLRTRMPFDFSKPTISGSARVTHHDLADKTKTSFSGLITDTYQTGLGEIGFLLNGSLQRGAYRTDALSIEPYQLRTGIVDRTGNGSTADAADAVIVPNGVGQFNNVGDRRRIGISAAVQWKPADNLEVYGQFDYANYKFNQVGYLVYPFGRGGAPITPGPASSFSFDENGEFQSGTFQNVFVEGNTYRSDRRSKTASYSGGLKFNPSSQLTLTTDVSYVDSRTKTEFFALGVGSDQPNTLSVDITGKLPVIGVTGAGSPSFLTDPANFSYLYILDSSSRSHNDQWSVRQDVEYETDGGFFTSIKAGVRYTKLNAVVENPVFGYVDLFDTPRVPRTPLSAIPGYYNPVPVKNFFRGDAAGLGSFLIPPFDVIRGDLNAVRQTFASYYPDGQVAVPEYLPTGRNDVSEQTIGGYWVARFKSETILPFDGNLGVRIVNTKTNVAGFQTPSGGPTIPIDQTNSYTSVLPSLNIRFPITETLQLRLAASKGLTRPDYNLLNSVLTFDPVSRRGSSGNPDLKPLRADQLDVSFEWYFNKTSSVYAAAFYKAVNGFIARVDDPVVIDGTQYQINRPVNGANGKIKGFEVGYQQFFDFLPGPLSGFGVQANYTYVDSKAPNPSAGAIPGAPISVPLEGLSKNSYNLVGIYEKYGLSARVAYNWRDDYVRTTSASGTGNLPIYDRAFGQLDASISYDVTPNITASVDATNLLNTRRETFFGLDSRPRDYSVVDRRFGATLRVNY